MNLRHVGIVVTDLNISKEFWCKALGGSIYSEMREKGEYIDKMMGLQGVDVTTVKLKLPEDDVGVELLHFHSHPADGPWKGTPYSIGLTHIAVTANDIEKTYKHLKQIGINFLEEPQYSPDGKVRVIYAQGPDNVFLEFVEVLNTDD